MTFTQKIKQQNGWDLNHWCFVDEVVRLSPFPISFRKHACEGPTVISEHILYGVFINYML